MRPSPTTASAAHARAARAPRADPHHRPVLPGRAPACTWPTRAEPRPRRWPSASPPCRRKRKVAAVYASPLERTRETAAPIAKALGLRVRRDQGLLECDFGEWTGAELKELSKLPEWQTVQRYPSGFRFPGGESFTEMQTRIGGADRRRSCAAHPGETIVAVSHADPIKAAVAHALGTHLDLFQRIVVSPCSVTAILYGADGPVVLAVNSTGRPVRPGAVVSELRSTCPTSGPLHRRHRRRARASASSTSRPPTATWWSP